MAVCRSTMLLLLLYTAVEAAANYVIEWKTGSCIAFCDLFYGRKGAGKFIWFRVQRCINMICFLFYSHSVCAFYSEDTTTWQHVRGVVFLFNFHLNFFWKESYSLYFVSKLFVLIFSWKRRKKMENYIRLWWANNWQSVILDSEAES